MGGVDSWQGTEEAWRGVGVVKAMDYELGRGPLVCYLKV